MNHQKIHNMRHAAVKHIADQTAKHMKGMIKTAKKKWSDDMIERLKCEGDK